MNVFCHICHRLNARSGWDHLGQAQEVNVLFDRSELSAMQKHQMGVEGGHGVGHVESAFTTRSNANVSTACIHTNSFVEVSWYVPDLTL